MFVAGCVHRLQGFTAAPRRCTRANGGKMCNPAQGTDTCRREVITSPVIPSRRQAGILLASVLASTAWPANASSPQKVFVAGSTGQTGRRVVGALRAQGISVVAGVRDTAKATSAGFDKDPQITVVVADVTQSPQDLAKAMVGCDAVVCATGGGAVTPFDKRAKTVDNLGTQHLVDAAGIVGATSFVLVSSLLTNGKNLGQEKNPNFAIINFFGGVLDEKLKAEQYLRKSGLRWTIVRPGGLSGDSPDKVGNLIVGSEDSFLALDDDPGREISRETVAAVCVQALLQDKAANKVFEIVASPSSPSIPQSEWFSV